MWQEAHTAQTQLAALQTETHGLQHTNDQLSHQVQDLLAKLAQQQDAATAQRVDSQAELRQMAERLAAAQRMASGTAGQAAELEEELIRVKGSHQETVTGQTLAAP
ncbi:hypothetical protein HaLaN_18657 [Haematococcus lacustris]|uniref:Uncharacterized protein n=1 Tax=Haematococcus lacustris TaxID=44745 RepID=A0A699ZF84_HAELA|nr:hypothetical protein HaLaN_18657 [Haematococcus lacustris]